MRVSIEALKATAEDLGRSLFQKRFKLMVFVAFAFVIIASTYQVATAKKLEVYSAVEGNEAQEIPAAPSAIDVPRPVESSNVNSNAKAEQKRKKTLARKKINKKKSEQNSPPVEVDGNDDSQYADYSDEMDFESEVLEATQAINQAAKSSGEKISGGTKVRAIKPKTPAVSIEKRLAQADKERAQAKASKLAGPLKGQFDAVPSDQVLSIANRVRLTETILRKHARAYDYRVHTTQELRDILSGLDSGQN